MGKRWVQNEITGLQKTALMHASAHLVVDISGAVLIDQLTQLLELPILYLNAHLIAATGIQHESKLLGGQITGRARGSSEAHVRQPFPELSVVHSAVAIDVELSEKFGHVRGFRLDLGSHCPKFRLKWPNFILKSSKIV